VKWTALDSAREFGALYQSGEWYIRHYAEPQTLGCGITCARVYRMAGNHREVQMAEFTGESALTKAMDYAQKQEAA
jgi:hypothetical protein